MDVTPENVDTSPAAGTEVSTEADVNPTINTDNLLTGMDDNIQPDVSGESWLNQLSEEYSSNPNVNKYQTLDEAAKGLINQASLIGKKGLIKPGENATQEEIDTFYNAIGRPVKSDMYKYEPIEGAPPVDDSAMAGFQEFAHNKGFTQEQFQAAIEFDYQRQQAVQESFEQERVQEANTTQMELMEEMGEVEYQAFLKDASSAANSLGLYDVLVDNGLAGNKEVLKALANASKHLGSSNMVGDQKVSNLDFDGQLNELRSHEAYRDKLHPLHNDIIAKIDKLYARRYPN